MSKKEWFEAWVATKQNDIKVNVEGLGWAGFWIGLGIVIAAGVMKGQLNLND